MGKENITRSLSMEYGMLPQSKSLGQVGPALGTQGQRG